MQQSAEIVERFKEEMSGMKMLLESKGVELNEANLKLENEREVFRSKIAGLKDEVEIKEKRVLEIHNQQIEKDTLVKNTEAEM